MRRILTARDQHEMLAPWRTAASRLRTASPMFDWRPSPEYESPGLTADHHSAPLENGDRLHVYRLNVQAENPWVFEFHPHDMPSRLPLRWNPELDLFKDDPQVGDMAAFLRRWPNSPITMAIARDDRVDPPGTDRSRRNFSVWSRQVDDPVRGKKWENGTFHPGPEEAMQEAEKRYLEEAPKWGDRAPHARGDLTQGFDYDDFFSNPTPPDDEDGFNIFGDR